MLIRQLIRFAIVGVIAALTDVGVLVILKEFFHLEVLLSSAISFAVSVTVNYILSMSFVFKSSNSNRFQEFAIFVLLSIGGLGLNQLILWFGVAFTSLHYLVIKIIGMVIVPVYNFVTRKIFLESKNK